jgi:tripartite-type tricarboxylate transporter receptor subunit TctC
MKLPRRQFLHVAAGAIALPVLARIAKAELYPSRTITMIDPFPAGGPLDALGRILAEAMQATLGQPIMVENVTGASGTIGTGRVARATPDGYTLGLGYWGTHVANAAIYHLQYDVVEDFEPIALLARTPLLLVAKKATPADDLNNLIAWLRTEPCKVVLGTAGVGTANHIVGLLFQRETNTCVQSVPYRGVAPAMQDLVAGQIDLMFADTEVSLPQLRAGTIKAYAVSGRSRLAAAPEIPTFAEAGLPSLYFSQWYGLWAPKGTPRDIISTLNSATRTALVSPTVMHRLSELGMDIPPSEEQTTQALGRLQRSEIDKWWPIIKAANIKAE